MHSSTEESGLVPHDHSRRFGAFDNNLGVCVDHTDDDLKIVTHPFCVVDILNRS